MNNRFTEGFKEQAIQKALSRGALSLESLAQDLSVGYSTLESSRLAAHRVQDIARREGYNKHPVHIHSDNGGPMKGATILATFQALGIMPSYSRPSVSHSNPYSESLFKTLKYCPYDPASPFHDIEQARKWMNEFVSWYNHQHRHSGI